VHPTRVCSSLRAALLLTLVAARPAASVLFDDEPANDSIATASVQLAPTAAVTTDGGEFGLVWYDIDYIGLSNLSVGDVVVISTTPLDSAQFDDPDTLIGLFTSAGSLKCLNDDSVDNGLGSPLTAGFGSLCRFVIDSPGTWYVGVTGSGDPPFDGVHFYDGVYELHVTINALVPPVSTPTPTALPTPTPTAIPTPTPTPTPEPGLLLQLASGMVALAMLDKRRRGVRG